MNAQKFPSHWGQFFDEVVPAYVKNAYSPNPKWKNKPFSKDDIDFYMKSVRELSRLLRSDRKEVSSRQVVSYFEQAKNRSAYLLYFLNLQASKFFTLYDRHSDALSKAFDLCQKENRPFRVLDLGAGPGTASIALMLWAKNKKNLPEFDLTLVDQHRVILEDAQNILTEFKSAKDIRIIKSNCYDYRFDGQNDLTILGHVLNETETPEEKQSQFLSKIYEHTRGAGVLIVEPADKVSSQKLGNLRNHFLEMIPSRLWGPCMHEGKCPLTLSKDWCHFSFPAEIPGKWFRQISERMGSKREWVKFSYLWIASQEIAPPIRPKEIRLVVSEILRQHGQVPLVLLCEPEKTKRMSLDVLKTKNFKIFRGDVVKLPLVSSP